MGLAAGGDGLITINSIAAAVTQLGMADGRESIVPQDANAEDIQLCRAH